MDDERTLIWLAQFRKEGEMGGFVLRAYRSYEKARNHVRELMAEDLPGWEKEPPTQDDEWCTVWPARNVDGRLEQYYVTMEELDE